MKDKFNVAVLAKPENLDRAQEALKKFKSAEFRYFTSPTYLGSNVDGLLAELDVNYPYTLVHTLPIYIGWNISRILCLYSCACSYNDYIHHMNRNGVKIGMESGLGVDDHTDGLCADCFTIGDDVPNFYRGYMKLNLLMRLSTEGLKMVEISHRSQSREFTDPMDLLSKYWDDLDEDSTKPITRNTLYTFNIFKSDS